MNFFRQHWKLLSFIIVMIAVIGVLQYRRTHQPPPPLHTVKPQYARLVETLDVSGVIDAKEKATLRFANGGKVTYLGAQEGDAVKKWQVIARIDTQDLQKRLQQDLNLYFNQRMTFDQAQADRRDQAPTDASNRTAQKDQKTLENAVLDVQIQDIAIRNTILSSPIDGILVSSPTPVSGVNLLATDEFNIVNPKTLVFRATVDQADIAKVQKGQATSITLDPYPNESINTLVSYIAYNSSDSSTGTVYVVEMPIQTSDGIEALNKYRLGMNGDAKIVLAEKDHALAIPIDATKERDGKTLVKVKTGPQATVEKEVQTGLQTEDQVEVVSGLSPSDEVVIP